MPLFNPFQRLRQLLSTGAERRVARFIRKLRPSRSTLVRFIGETFFGLAKGGIETFADLGESMIDAGQAANQLGPGDTLADANFPVNEFLFGDNPAGRRAQVGVELTSVVSNDVFEVLIDVEDLISVQDVIGEAFQEGGQRIRYLNFQVGDVTTLGDTPPQDIFEVHFVFGERRF